jgi:NAD(P)-dependent dehydrogenase (short-subunit alcohol dehydrogenase family)
VAAEIGRAATPGPLSLTADAADLAAMREVAARVAEDRGGCDHVVVAAGIGSGNFGFPFWNLEPSDWDRVLQVNIMGPVHAAHAFSPLMIKRGRGTFLFFASVAAQIGSQTDPPYSAAKAAVVNFAQCAAKDLAAYNIRVNTISPGMIQTPLNRSVWQAWNDQQPDSDKQSYEQWAGDKVRKVSPLGRWQTPEDCAAVAAFLASPRAQNITGQTINVDGGQVMHA